MAKVTKAAEALNPRKEEVALIVREHGGYDALGLRLYGLKNRDAVHLLELELEGRIRYTQDPVTHRWGWNYFYKEGTLGAG